MTQPIEREYKILLTKEQYEILLHSYDYSEIRNQTNQYYDTDTGFIKNLRGAMRIRDLNNNHIFTLKIRNDNTSNIELEKQIDTDNIHKIADKEVLNWIMKYDIPMNDIHKTFKITTIRNVFETPDAEICLDKTSFNDHITDYEIEYELKNKNGNIEKFNEFLKPAKIVYEKNCPSKIARAAHYSNL